MEHLTHGCMPSGSGGFQNITGPCLAGLYKEDWNVMGAYVRSSHFDESYHLAIVCWATPQFDWLLGFGLGMRWKGRVKIGSLNLGSSLLTVPGLNRGLKGYDDSFY